MLDVYNRVQDEYEELEIKYLSLHDLLDKPQPTFISDKQWKLLNKQIKPMKKYRKILAKRLDDMYPHVFGEHGEHSPSVPSEYPDVRITERSLDR